MQHKSITCLCIFILILLASLLSGCDSEKAQLDKYENCTAACSMTIGSPSPGEDGYTELYLCNEECKKKFL